MQAGVSHETHNSTAPNETAANAGGEAGAPLSLPHPYAGAVRSFMHDRLGIGSLHGPLLARVAHAGSRELFLLTIVAIAVGTAMLGQIVGISFALGAFLAGLVVSESEFSAQVVDEIIPVRDFFA